MLCSSKMKSVKHTKSCVCVLIVINFCNFILVKVRTLVNTHFRKTDLAITIRFPLMKKRNWPRSCFRKRCNLMIWCVLGIFIKPYGICTRSILNLSSTIRYCSVAVKTLCFVLRSSSSPVLQLGQTHSTVLSTLSIRPGIFTSYRDAYSYVLLLSLKVRLYNDNNVTKPSLWLLIF